MRMINSRFVRKILRKLSVFVLKPFDLVLITRNQESEYRGALLQNIEWDFNFLLNFSVSDREQLLKLMPFSKSQLRQDLFVLNYFGFKPNGYFVEFGATDGKQFSNTFMLEKQFGWTGILAEPAQTWHSQLRKNRAESIIDRRCVWKVSGEVIQFAETPIAELSSINHIQNQDEHAYARKNSKLYEVETVSLQNLLVTNNAPYEIDYLSIDTEGSEFEILSSFDFATFNIKIITCEHNYTENRDKIYNLLSQNGYRRVKQEISLFDDWYVKN